MLPFTKKVTSVTVACTHNYFKFKNLYNRRPPTVILSFCFLCWNLYTKSAPHGKYLYLSFEWCFPCTNRSFEHKDKEKAMRRHNLQGCPALLHQFVFCRFYYYYCQMAIKKSNLYSMSWCYTVPEDKRLRIGLILRPVLMDRKEQRKSHVKLAPHPSEGWEVRKRHFTKICWGTHDLQPTLHTYVVGGSTWILEKAKKRPQEVKRPSK